MGQGQAKVLWSTYGRDLSLSVPPPCTASHSGEPAWLQGRWNRLIASPEPCSLSDRQNKYIPLPPLPSRCQSVSAVLCRGPREKAGPMCGCSTTGSCQAPGPQRKRVRSPGAHLAGIVGLRSQGDRDSGCRDRCPRVDRVQGGGRGSLHAHRGLLWREAK